MNFDVTKSEIVFRGKVFDLQVDEIVYHSGNKGVRETALHHGGSVIVPVLDSGKIILIKQFRYPLRTMLFELPAGKLFKGEDPEVCAVRELEEETGYKTGKIMKLGAIATTPGFCTEILHIYLATGLTPGEPHREEGEDGMEMFEFTLDEIEEMISSQQIYDAKTLSGILYYKLLLQKLG
jgi:ADP-ribose pyrophosphatase